VIYSTTPDLGQNNLLKNKKVLIFGGLGFLGTNLAKRACQEGAEVTIVELHKPIDCGERLGYINGPVNVVEADIREAQKVREVLEDKDVVYCFASVSGAVNTNKNPHLSLSIDCTGYLNILEAARELDSKSTIVLPSSWLVYGRLPVGVKAKEDFPTRPISIYGIHKLACENYSYLYSDLHELNTLVLRISNPYGPFQSRGNEHYGIINNFINSALNGEDLLIFGNGHQLRDYLYIGDLVGLLITAGLCDNNGEPYNVGSGVSTRLIDIAELVIDICGSGRIKHVEWPTEYSKVEPGDYCADIEKVRGRFGWNPGISIEDGLNRTLETIKRKP
jgi:UDP-glucose 4-epimerase